MKREIKFRVWVESTLGDYMAMQDETDLESLGNFICHHSNCKNIMQFTGLKDKNGVDIYEGDILKISLYDNEWITIVRSYYGTLVIDIEGMEFDFTALSFLDDEAITKVIGNIHENP